MDKVRHLLCKLLSNNNRHRKDFAICRQFHSCLQRMTNNVTGIASSEVRRYKVVFIGNDNFSLPSLAALSKLLTPENVCVVVNSEKNLVSKFAKSQNQRIFLWNDFKREDFDESGEERSQEWDFGVVASFGYLIPARVINRFPMGVLNVHASLLPRWRGASPINHAIINGDNETGVSIMKIAPHKFDVGPVLLQASTPLTDQIRAPELLQIIAELGASTLIKVIQELPRYLANPVPQDDLLATAAPKLTPDLAEVDWISKSASQVYRLYRGLYGAYKLNTTFLERKVELDEIELPSDKCLVDLPQDRKPGGIVYLKSSDAVYVKCAEESWVAIRKLKISVKWMTAKDFKNGFLSKGKLSGGSVPQFYLDKSTSSSENREICNSLSNSK